MDLEVIAQPELIWFLIGITMLFLEFVIPGLVIFFFGIGAWVTALICLIVTISLNLQLLVFLATSVLSLVLLRKRLKTIFTGSSRLKKGDISDLDEFIGQGATVTREIQPGQKGRVEFHGTNWDAESEEQVAVGERVEITGKNNITLLVKPVRR